jgi:hypothetical protein
MNEFKRRKLALEHIQIPSPNAPQNIASLGSH